MSSKLPFLLYFVLISLKLSSAVQELTIYSEPDQGGSSITFQEKIPDLSNWTFFLETASSFCSTGRWHFFSSTNYQGESFNYFGLSGENFAYDVERCDNMTYANFSSVRHMGPADTRTAALALFEGSPNNLAGGREHLITGSAETNFDFLTPKYISSFGNSNWTLYSEINFQGIATCFSSQGRITYSDQNEAPIGSVLKGCVESTNDKNSDLTIAKASVK